MGAVTVGSSRARRLLAVAMVVLTGACGAGGGSTGDDGAAGSGSSGPSVVRVFAAASLADAFADLESRFESSDPRYDIELNLAGSSSLAAQILAGAPADVFASANATIIDQVVSDPSTEAETAQTFATNRLLVAVPEQNPAGLTGIGDFARSELFLGLCAAEVPCGSLAEAVLAEAGIVPSIDTREPDVRALLTKIAEGELDGGLVYETDVLAAVDEVDSIAITSAVPAARYPITVLGAGSHIDGGRAFVSFVLSPDGQAILADHGFGSP